MKKKECFYGINIYDRQERKKGWKQKRLKKAKLALIGCDHISHFLLGALCGLGVGHREEKGHLLLYGYGKISRYEKQSYPFYLEAREGDYKVSGLEEIGKKINPNLEIKGINWSFSDKDLDLFFRKEDLIVEATNDLEIKEMFIKFSNKTKKPLISASCDKDKLKIFFNLYKQGELCDFSEFEDKKQNIITGELAAGIIADEIRKFFNPLKGDFFYDKKEFEFQLFENSPSSPKIENSHFLIVGFGTGGCWEAPVYASFGVSRMDIVDPDYIEPTNLNRQWLFYCSRGKWKVDVGKKRLKLINPKLRIRAYKKRFEDLRNSYFRKNLPDIIIEGVDNYETRYEILKDSLKYKIPYVSTGVIFDAGRVVTTYPGKTSNLEEVLGISRFIRKRKASCNWERNPSIVTTNVIISALSIAEVLKVLDPSYGEPFDGIIRYESNSRDKIFYRKMKKF